MFYIHHYAGKVSETIRIVYFTWRFFVSNQVDESKYEGEDGERSGKSIKYTTTTTTNNKETKTTKVAAR